MLNRFVFLLLTLGLVSACSNTPVHKSSQKSSNKGMKLAAKNIYVDPKMSDQQCQRFLKVVNQSKTEISRFFGGMKSAPTIYACTTKSCFRKFGGVPAKAKAIGDNTVILSSKGLNKVTLTHELAHVELHKRLGSAKVWNKVPMWFDEGLAVLACDDPKYNKSVKMMPLHNLVSQGQWINAVHDQVPAYSIARQAVKKWYNNVGKQGLQSMIDRMQKGESFSLTPALNSELQISRL